MAFLKNLLKSIKKISLGVVNIIFEPCYPHKIVQIKDDHYEFKYAIKNIPHFEKRKTGGEDAWIA